MHKLRATILYVLYAPGTLVYTVHTCPLFFQAMGASWRAARAAEACICYVLRMYGLWSIVHTYRYAQRRELDRAGSST